jgi:hypothetical protein
VAGALQCHRRHARSWPGRAMALAGIAMTLLRATGVGALFGAVV